MYKINYMMNKINTWKEERFMKKEKNKLERRYKVSIEKQKELTEQYGGSLGRKKHLEWLNNRKIW